MTKEYFINLKNEWEKLNLEYDSYIQNFFNSLDNTKLNSDKIQELKEMQERLYKLELEWFNIVEGKIIIEK